jgi:hypothetical protein
MQKNQLLIKTLVDVKDNLFVPVLSRASSLKNMVATASSLDNNVGVSPSMDKSVVASPAHIKVA